MATKRAEKVIDRSADVVWGRIGDFGELSWVPRNAGCEVDGDIRTIYIEGLDFQAYQQLLEHDDEKRMHRYRTAEAPPGAKRGPIPYIETTLVVTPLDESSCVVTWDVETDESAVDATNREYQGILDNLKVVLET